MCGRFASSRPVGDLLVHFDIAAQDRVGEDVDGKDTAAEGVTGDDLPPSWNVAPTDPVRVVLERHGRRRLQVARWGLVPSWAKDRSGAARRINARRETLSDRPAFRSAFERRRCLVPADGYYEWQVLGADGGGDHGGGDRSRVGRSGGVRKQPWYLTSHDGAPLAMAGLYEVWRAGDGLPLWTCTVVTTDAPDDTGRIHDRTPLLVPREDWARWLDPGLPDPGSDLLVPGTPGRLCAWPVGPGVGNVRNNGPELVAPGHD